MKMKIMPSFDHNRSNPTAYRIHVSGPPITELFFLCLFFLACLSSNGYASDPLAYRNRGNRFEGHNKISVFAPPFEALSFLKGAPFDSKTHLNTIYLNFYLPTNANVFINARELTPLKYYQMNVIRTDWPRGWNRFGPWETSAVIRPLEVSFSNIGVIARVDSRRIGSGTLAALSISPPGVTQTENSYELQFRAKYDLKKVICRVEHAPSDKIIYTEVQHDLIGGAPISIRFDMSNHSIGWYRIVVDCLYLGRRGGPQRTFSFFHHK